MADNNFQDNFQAPSNTDDPQGQDDAQITAPSQLPEDPGTPFQSADDHDVVLGDAHQATDNQSDIDSHELYDEGLPGAAEAGEPKAPIDPDAAL